MNFDVVKENKKAIWFLGVFVGLYLLLNTLYGFYIQHYYPSSDPVTYSVTWQVASCLKLFDPSITLFPSAYSEYIAIANDRENVIYVYEGCNGVNVAIVYFSFLFAFKGKRNLLVKYILGGTAGIHLLNLTRIGLLYAVAFYFPDQLYFFHKYFFTGIIYVIVFVLWYFWVRSVKNE